MAVCALLVMTMGSGADAAVRKVGGNAYGVRFQGTVLGLGVNVPPQPRVEILSTATANSRDASVATIKFPAVCGGVLQPACVLRTGLVEVHIEGDPSRDLLNTYGSSTIHNLSFAGIISATTVKAECSTDSTGGAGTVTFENLVIGGTPIPVTVPQDTTIPLPGIGSVILHEKTSGDNSVVVPPDQHRIFDTWNALHVKLNGALGTADLVVAHAACFSEQSQGSPPR